MSTPFRPEQLAQQARTWLTGAFALARQAAHTLPEVLEQAASGLLEGEEALRKATLAALELARLRYPLQPPAPKAAEAPVQLLVAADLGTGRADTELRLQALSQQLKAAFPHYLELSTVVQHGASLALSGLRQLPLPSFFLRKLDAAVRAHHGVIGLDETLLAPSTPGRHPGLVLAALGLAAADFKPTVALAGSVAPLSAERGEMVRECLSQAERFALVAEGTTLQLHSQTLALHEGAELLYLSEPGCPTEGKLALEALGLSRNEPVITLVVASHSTDADLSEQATLIRTLHAALSPQLVVMALNPDARLRALKLRQLLAEVPTTLASTDTLSSRTLNALLAASEAIFSDEPAALALAFLAKRPCLAFSGGQGAIALMAHGPAVLAASLAPESGLQVLRQQQATIQLTQAKAFFTRLRASLLSRFPELASQAPKATRLSPTSEVALGAETASPTPEEDA